MMFDRYAPAIITVAVLSSCAVLIMSLAAQERQTDPLDAMRKSLPERSTADLIRLASELDEQLWDRFVKGQGKEKREAAMLIAYHSPANLQRRAELVDYLRKERTDHPKNSNEYTLITLALAGLDDPAAEAELLTRILLEKKRQDDPRRGSLNPFEGLKFGLSRTYLEPRGGKVYLVSRLHSSNRELRHVAWDVLKKFHDIPDDLAFEPEMSPDGQRVMLERLERWSRENDGKERGED